MRLLPLFDVQIMHDYYGGGCPDFELEPSAETRQHLANYRCTIKPLSNGIRIFVALNGQNNPIIPMPDDLRWTFYLRLRNPDFALFTELEQVQDDLVPLFSYKGLNAGALVELAWQPRQEWQSDTFLVQQPTIQDYYVLRSRPLTGETTAFLISGNGFNLSNFDPVANVITLDSSRGQSGDTFTVTYRVMPALQNNRWGEVEIWSGDLQPTDGELLNKFQVTFKAKQTKWIYYLVTDIVPDSTSNHSTNNEWRIQDKGTPPITFVSQQADPSDRVAQQLAAQYPSLQHWRFVSDAPIACQATARKSLQLLINDNQVMAALPNPSLQNYRITKDETSLYQIVTYFSN